MLDTVRREPLYAEYKRRTVELLDPRPGGRYLEVGTGTGDDALAFAARFGASVVGVDSSTVMVEEAKRRGFSDAVVADALALPFEDDSFDGAWADRTSLSAVSTVDATNGGPSSDLYPERTPARMHRLYPCAMKNRVARPPLERRSAARKRDSFPRAAK